MSLPAVISREEWLAARKELLQQEKELTRLRDALNTSRRQLPMVRIDKEYVFEGPDGAVSLAGMFGPSRQLILQHVMYDPGWDDACPSCSAGLDEMSAGLLRNMRARDTAFAGVFLLRQRLQLRLQRQHRPAGDTGDIQLPGRG